MNDRPMYYDMDGKPILGDPNDPQDYRGTLTWARMYEGTERHIGDDTVNGIRISTVYLGLDHRFGEGPPLIFETMLFGGEEALDQWQMRYATKEEALRGHNAAVAGVRAWFGQRALEEKV